MSNNKKTFAPSIKFYPTKSDGSYSRSITEAGHESIAEVLKRVELGGKLMIRKVSDAYKAKASGDGSTAPEFELVVFTAKEMEEYRTFAKKNAETDSL